jgi:glycosyltransferase involved in cell wall biosynthesis
MLPSLSVMVPNYNHAKYLPTCLKAILAQSLRPLEIIVLDDASTDNSLEVIRHFVAEHPIIRLVQNEKNLGVMPNLNKGVELSRGEYVYIASADDEVVPGLFEKSMRLLVEHPEAAYCCAMAEWRETFSTLTWQMGTKMPNKECYLAPEELVKLGRQGRLALISSSGVQRRDFLRAAGNFPPQLRWHADWFAFYVTGLRHGVCFIPEVLSVANLLPTSFYQSGSKRLQHQEVLRQLLEMLHSPAYTDVLPRIRESGVLSLFEWPIFRQILARREYRHLINATFLRQAVRRSAELRAKKLLPQWFARWLLNRFYRKKSSDTISLASPENISSR